MKNISFKEIELESISFDYTLGTCVIGIDDNRDNDMEIKIHADFENWLRKNDKLEKFDLNRVGYDGICYDHTEMTMEEFVIETGEVEMGDLHIDFLKTLPFAERTLLFTDKI